MLQGYYYKPQFAKVSSLLNVKMKYLNDYQYLVNHMVTLVLVPVTLAIQWVNLKHIILLPISIVNSLDDFHFQILYCCYFLVAACIILYHIAWKPRAVLLVDFACFKPPAAHRLPFASFMEHARFIFSDHPDLVEYQRRVLERSGLGDDTCVPPATLLPRNPTMQHAREEAELVLFSAMDSLFLKTGLRPNDIDILIINCSAFSPTPSLSSMVINKYKLPTNIKSFNLSGMGCSAGLISIDLARDLLHAHPNSYAVVLSTEIITPFYYRGNHKPMLISNCFFRMGAAAILLSNRWSDRRRAKYRLLHLVRTHTGADDKAYGCLFQEDDKEGRMGISIHKDLVEKAGEAVKSNMTTLGPLVLPLSEKLLVILGWIGTKMWKAKPYIPDFKKAFDHFCIHVGGRPIIDEMQRRLRLSDVDVEASRMTLHRFGNTASSSVWYELSYIEEKGRMKKGDRVWQIAFGSGFKCNSAVWKCNRRIEKSNDGPWADCIDRYPVRVIANLYQREEEEYGGGKGRKAKDKIDWEVGLL